MIRFLGTLSGGKFRGYPDPEIYKDHCILWRGYIANAGEVAREARSRGLDSRDGLTGEMFDIAYRLWGIELEHHVAGEYSVAIYDETLSELFLTHDAFGLVPLFYGRLSGTLFVASHLEDIIAKTGIGELDDEFIADYIANPSSRTHRTAYRGISRLAPGMSLVCSDGNEKEITGPLLAEPGPYAGGDHAERFLQLLAQGVSAAMPPAGTAWCELSGGLDSSSIFSLAARKDTGRLGAFSIVYNVYGEANETKWIRSILDRYPVPRYALDGDNALPYSEVPDRFCAEPGLNLIDWAGRRVYEKMAADHGASVVLTGQGGDLVFFGMGPMPYYCADLARTLKVAQLAREIRRWKTSDRHRRSYLFWLIHYVMRPLAAHLRSRPVLPAWHRGTSPFINPEYAKKWSLDERGAGKPRKMSTIEHSWFMEQLTVICGQITQINQIPRNFEFRHPVLFRPLVEFMMSLPQDLKFTPGTDRILQRMALNGILPDEIRLRRHKTIYDQPAYEGLRQGKDFTFALTDDPVIVKRGIADPEKWREAVSQARLGRTYFLPQFEAAASLEIWLGQIEAIRNGDPHRLLEK